MGARPRVASRPRRESARVVVDIRAYNHIEKKKKLGGNVRGFSNPHAYQKIVNSLKSTREQADKQDNRIDKRPLAVRVAIVVAPNERKNHDS